MTRVLLSLLALSATVLLPLAHAEDVQRHAIPGSNFPISAAVEVPAGHALVLLSGKTPPVANPTARKGSVAVYGDMETQTVGALKRIQEQLQGMHLDLGDVVQMRAYLVGNPEQNDEMDFDGFMRGYSKFFGTSDQPKLPARTALKIAGLAVPGMLVEIEVTAVRP
ncbi:MAG: RidA family protein [Rhodanobacter sp.]